MMIEEAYISFETAKLLKEKGFNEECQGYFEVPKTSFPFSYKQKTRKVLNVLPKDWNSYLKECVTYEHISIPTQQMAMRWLREVHGIFIEVNCNCNNLELTCTISKVEEDFGDKVYEDVGFYFQTYSYEEAVEAGIKYALENLI